MGSAAFELSPHQRPCTEGPGGAHLRGFVPVVKLCHSTQTDVRGSDDVMYVKARAWRERLR